MAVYMLSSEYLALNGVDRSAHVKSATLTVDAAELDTTDFASGGWKECQAGIKSGQLQITFQDDVTDASIDDILWAIFATVVTFEVRPTSSSVSTNNPKYTGSVLIKGHSIGGGVGELAMKQVTYPTSGTITRAEA